mmetsp:Transcript_28135/g.42560  ORF Transcript_28135/g.42560 Transcript_28135/m.42560 type:complete len:228 (-) Transcript_28135:280-963(-)
MFSSGLPVLYPIACLFNIAIFWVYKTLLLKFYQRTIKFNEGLATHTIGYIKYGILFHMIIGGLMYSNSSILSSENEKYVHSLTQWVGFSYFEDRFISAYSIIYLAGFTILIILYVFKNFVVEWLFKYLLKAALCSCCRKHSRALQKFVIEKDHFYLSDDIYKELEISQLIELYKRCSRELNEYNDFTNHSQEFYISDLYRWFQMEQKARLKNIETTIDDHMAHLLSL